MSSRQLVVFCIDNEEFGIEIANVKEIIEPVEIFKIPNAPVSIEGLINLRGKVHSIFSLRKRFNLPADDFNDSTKFIITRLDSTVIGFIADEVRQIILVEDCDIDNFTHASSEAKSKFSSGVAKLGNRRILLLDPENAFPLKDISKNLKDTSITAGV